MKRRKRFPLLVIAVIVFAACGDPGPKPADDERPLFVYVTPDPLGINDFLIMGQIGLERAAAKHGARTLVLESEDPTTRDENVRAAIAEGAELVVVLGFEFGDILPRAAREAPGVEFLIVDQCIDERPANIHCAVFREYEAAFLIGATAAALSETGRVGVIGAADIPFLHRYTEGFATGARYVDPEIDVSTLWVGGLSPFSDPVRAKEQALAMAAAGIDQILAATAAGNLGVFEAAREQGFSTYGIDVNECPKAPGVVVECMIKKVDVAVVEAIDAILAGTAPEVLEYGLADHGVGLVTLTADDPEASGCTILEHPQAMAAARDLERRIVAGEIVLDDPMFPGR